MAAVSALVDVVANVQRRVMNEPVGADVVGGVGVAALVDGGAVTALLEDVAPRRVQGRSHLGPVFINRLNIGIFSCSSVFLRME